MKDQPGRWKVCANSICSLYGKTVILVYIATFCVILPIICHKWVYSMYLKTDYFDKYGDDMMKDLNEQRLKKADNYIKTLDKNQNLKFYGDNLKCDIMDFLVAVVTVKRKSGDFGYLTQTLAAIDKELKRSKNKCESALVICNAHFPPEKHQEAINASEYFISVPLVPYSNDSVPRAGKRKEQLDKIKCFKSVMKYQFRYLILVEDDAVPEKGFLPILKNVLLNQVESKISRGEPTTNVPRWAYLNLHFPISIQGYFRDLKSVGELIGICLIGGTIFAILCFMMTKNKSNINRDFIVGAIFITLLTFMMGRQHSIGIWKYRYQVLRNSECCTPATVYPKYQIEPIVEFLESVRCKAGFGIDLALSTYGEKFNLRRYVIFPNLFRHIGMHSSLHPYVLDAKNFL